MRKEYLLGVRIGVVLLLMGAVAVSFGNSAAPQPSATDVKECNEYAEWIAERGPVDSRTTIEGAQPHGALLNTGTVDGLADDNQENARAAQAYRRCMARRGYKVWG